jgi:hypothetical protein
VLPDLLAYRLALATHQCRMAKAAPRAARGAQHMEGLQPGRIVYYVFDERSADEVNRRRTTGPSIASRMRTVITTVTPGEPIGAWPAGAQAHIGPAVAVGDILPAMVVRVNSDTSVNLKVMLDGTDEYWATAVDFAENKRPRSWHWMFEGQQARYQPDRTASPEPPSATE